jgi:hypothetical protein
MRFRTTAIALVIVGLFGVSALTGQSWAGKSDGGVVHKIEALNEAAIAAYGVGNHKKARAKLQEAVALGKRGHLDKHPALARTYVHLGIVQLQGLHDRDAAMKSFVSALRIRPAIEVTPALATANVLLDFEEARAELPATAASDDRETEKLARAKEQQVRRKDDCEAEVGGKFEAERDALQQQIAHGKEAVANERQARELLQKQKMDAERQLADLRDSERAERTAKEKLMRDLPKLEKQLADAREAERKEREARAAADKQAAEARELLAKEKQLAEARQKERLERREQEMQAQERIADGPDRPADMPPTLFCAALEDSGQAAGVFVRCLARAKGKAPKSATLYYRASGATHYEALPMKHARSGAFTAIVLATNVTGTMLQYYVQATDPKGDLVALNGRPSLPNIVTLLPRPLGTPSLAKVEDTTPAGAR